MSSIASALSGMPQTQNANAAIKANPADSSTSSSSSSSSTSSSDITSNDFLTLLVTELQNQDPTQPTDPNTYIQQLVGVNSLQQLISINQDLS
jgi:flagellar basal-body rod modification protein FlgD